MVLGGGAVYYLLINYIVLFVYAPITTLVVLWLLDLKLKTKRIFNILLYCAIYVVIVNLLSAMLLLIYYFDVINWYFLYSLYMTISIFFLFLLKLPFTDFYKKVKILYLIITPLVLAFFVYDYRHEKIVYNDETLQELIEFLGIDLVVSNKYYPNYKSIHINNDTLVAMHDTRIGETFYDKQFNRFYLYQNLKSPLQLHYISNEVLPDRYHPYNSRKNFEYRKASGEIKAFKNGYIYGRLYDPYSGGKNSLHKLGLDSSVTEIFKNYFSYGSNRNYSIYPYPNRIVYISNKGIYISDGEGQEIIFRMDFHNDSFYSRYCSCQLGNDIIFSYADSNDTYTLISLNVNSTNKNWSVQNLVKSGCTNVNIPNNSTNIILLSEDSQTSFIDITYGDTVSTIPFYFLNPHFEDDVVFGSKHDSILAYNFRKDSVLWTVPGNLQFLYKNFMIGKIDNDFVIYDKYSGVLKRSIKSSGSSRKILYFDDYMLIDTNIYSLKELKRAN